MRASVPVRKRLVTVDTVRLIGDVRLAELAIEDVWRDLGPEVVVREPLPRSVCSTTCPLVDEPIVVVEGFLQRRPLNVSTSSACASAVAEDAVNASDTMAIARSQPAEDGLTHEHLTRSLGMPAVLHSAAPIG